MARWTAVAVAGLMLVGARAYAQERRSGPGTFEVTAIPAGGTFFVGSDTEPGFGNYDLGGALSYRITRLFGVEGELGGTIGVAQDLQLGGQTMNEKTPNMLGYTGNIVLSGPIRHAMMPYVTGGIGGLTVFERASLGINDTENHLTGNVGGGVTWYAGKHWGIRGDYRFMGMRAKDNAPAFFGQESRHSHRVYGALVVDLSAFS
jgi:hypothetical protein